MIQDGKKVKFNFTLHADGKLIESTKGTPFEYTHGRDNIFSGLKKGLEGMKEKEEKTIVLSPLQEAYGEHVDELYQELPRESLARDIKPEIGMTLQLQKEGGERKLATITGIKDDSIVLNFNHPLAGQTLKFEVKVEEVGS